MAERRTLLAGLKVPEGVDPEQAERFLRGEKADSGKPTATADADADAEEPNRKRQSGSAIKRVPLTTRIREDFAAALKRASLERQLKGEFPNTILDILEEALEPWLRKNGHIQ